MVAITTERDWTVIEPEEKGRIGAPRSHAWIRADALCVDPAYQRHLKERRVKKIVNGFDPDMLGELVVSQRADGTLAVLDGQHRLAAIRRMGYGDQLVPCMVYAGLTLEQEASRFWKPQRERDAISAGDLFRARLLSGDPVAHDVKRIVEAVGYSIGFDQGQDTEGGRIVGVGTLEQIYGSSKNGPADLEAVLRIARDAWGVDGTAIKSVMTLGLYRFHTRYRGAYDRGRLVGQLKSVVPAAVFSKGLAHAEAIGQTHPMGVARVILQSYNHLLRSNRLPAWDAK